MRTLIVLAALASTSMMSPLFAQGTPLVPGEAVRVSGVTLPLGPGMVRYTNARFEGDFIGFGRDSLIVIQAPDRQGALHLTLSRSSVVERSTFVPAKREGAVIGFFVGLSVGGVVGWRRASALEGDCDDCFYWVPREVDALMAGGIGALVGTLVGYQAGRFFEAERWESIPLTPGDIQVSPTPALRTWDIRVGWKR